MYGRFYIIKNMIEASVSSKSAYKYLGQYTFFNSKDDNITIWRCKQANVF